MNMTLNMPPVNPLLERSRLPGEIHRLPSRGIFYTHGELDPSVKDGEVQVHAMTMIDEITVRSPDLLFSGDAIKQVIRRCVPQILKPEALLAKDVDFLMLVLRKASYGDVEIQYEHNCKDAKSHSYIIPVDMLIKSARSIDPATVGARFSVTVPNGMVVKVSPMRFSSIVEMLQMTDGKLTPEQAKDRAIKTLLDIIESVDEITDKRMISEWLSTIPVGWTGEIDSAIQRAQDDWGSDMMFRFNCRDCGEEVKTAVPMNPLAFFI